MKKSLIALSGFLIFTGHGWALQDSTQAATQGTIRRGSRQSSTPSTGIETDARLIHLNGKIVMADGSPLPQSVRVDLNCLDRMTWQTQASPNGQFSFELGSSRQDGMALMDASVSNPGSGSLGSAVPGQPLGVISGRRLNRSLTTGGMNLNGCEILVRSVPGYWAENHQLGQVGEFDGNIGDVYLSPLAGVTGTTVSSKTLLAPKSAVKEYEKARRNMARKSVNLDKAAKELQKALQAYPDFAEAWNLLGELRCSQKDFPGAREALRKAIHIDPRYVNPYVLLTQVELSANRFAEAARASDQIVELNPYLLQGQYLHALAHFQLEDFPVAEKSILVLQSRGKEKQWPFIHFMMGTILAHRGDFPAAAGELARFLERPLPPSAAPMAESARMQLANWERQGLIPRPQRALLSKAGESRN